MPTNERKTTFTFLAEPTDVNFGGKVHGGAVMKWIDQVSYACAASWSGHYCVTVYVGGIQFYRPIQIGQRVRLEAKVIYTGSSSMHIAVDVYSRDLREGDWKKTTHCIIIFVDVDEKGKTVAVPKWSPKTEKDKALEDYAKRLMEHRQRIQEEMSPYVKEQTGA